MDTIQKGTYGASIHPTQSGDFDVYFLYNMGTQIHQTSNGDVWERKTFKTRKMVDRKIAAYFVMQGSTS